MAETSALTLLRALAEGVAARSGAQFFPHLVSALAQTLGASCAFASEFARETHTARVLAFWCDGRFTETFVYPLEGSPCARVLDNEIVAFPRNIREMLPAECVELAAIGAQSYLAMPLCGETGKVRGHLAVIDRRERDWNEVDFEVLKIFSNRAGAELERRDLEKNLVQANADLEARVTARTAELTAALAGVERPESRLQQQSRYLKQEIIESVKAVSSDALTLEALERAHIITVLKRTHGVIEGPLGAARVLNLKPSTARFRMKKLGIARTDYLAEG